MKLTRKKKMLLNTGTALIYQLITLVCGFVLPKFVVPYFGSATNGLVNSITQFLSIITLCECGIGAVVQSALYKPLADGDDDATSSVIVSSRNFFRKIMCIFGGYVVFLVVLYPIFIGSEYDFNHWFIASLIVILALSSSAQYYLFISYRLLLNADQASFIQLSAHSIALILNTVCTIVLIKLGAGIHIVKLASALVFFLQPLIIKWYVDRHYKLNMKLKLTEEPIKQKWNGFAQHVSTIVIANCGTMALTMFSSLENVSIYGVYYLVAHGIRQIVITLNTGVTAMLGNMYANGETEQLNKSYARTELFFHFIVTLFFTITAILIVPFMLIYTKEFTDADYIVPLFGILITASQAVYCLRIPYEMMIKVAGHYKETQVSSFIEAGIAVVLTVVGVICFGLIGSVLGVLVALAYRTVYLAWYLSRNILKRNICHFILHLVVDAVCVVGMVFATKFFELKAITYGSWIVMALEVGIVSLAVAFIIYFIFYRKMFIDAIRQKIFSKIRKHS